MDLIDRQEAMESFCDMRDGVLKVYGDEMYSDKDIVNTIKSLNKIDAILIPKDATNGDMFLMLFPNVLAIKLPHAVFIDFEDNITQLAFDRYWWDSKYKGGE